ncbi:hypothetical protein AAF712_000357 [Marasmius tenuissimus]|uniref:Uncharacterized protein n=1 Tax=Marasmius tenuissimus TaxID=585030 RepID=A0ABR3AI24_9AGAR
MDEAKIFCAISSMSYSLRKEVETLKSSRGRSWEEFKKEIESAWAIDAKYGSHEALRRVIDEFATMSLQVSESRFNAFVRRFRMEAAKLQKPPALLSNKTLVDMFLKAFDYMAMKDHWGGDAEESERRKQDPYTLEEVIGEAEMIMKSGSGYAYMQTSSESKMKRDAAEVPVPREVRQGTLRTHGKSEPAKKTELDDDTMKVLAKVDTYDTKLKTFQSDMEQFQTRVIENLQKCEKTLDNDLVELRKLIMTSATREAPKASYS